MFDERTRLDFFVGLVARQTFVGYKALLLTSGTIPQL